MEEKLARLKKNHGGTIIELYSDQKKRWYKYCEVETKSKAVQLCQQEGFKISHIR